VTSGQQVAMPAQDRFGTYQQSDPAQHVAGELVKQRGEEGSVGGGEPHLLAVQLPLEDHDLVA
jgi:hypothetical protein